MKADSSPETKIPDRAPECLRCRHFEVSWDVSFPRACALFGIKSRNMPSMEVFLSTGSHCFAFELKAGIKETPSGGGDGRWV